MQIVSCDGCEVSVLKFIREYYDNEREVLKINMECQEEKVVHKFLLAARELYPPSNWR